MMRKSMLRIHQSALRYSRVMSSTSEASGPMATRIRSKLFEAFTPQHLEVWNESYMHNVPKGAETHFKVGYQWVLVVQRSDRDTHNALCDLQVIVVADAFEGKPLIQRHRLVNTVLEQELAEGVHALSIQSKTPEQWAKNNTVQASPNCQGGMAKDPTKQEFLQNLKNSTS